jgi:hypothetical protein
MLDGFAIGDLRFDAEFLAIALRQDLDELIHFASATGDGGVQLRPVVSAGNERLGNRLQSVASGFSFEGSGQSMYRAEPLQESAEAIEP